MGCFKTGSNLLLSKHKKKRTVWLNPPVNLVINCFKLFVSFVQTKTHKIYKWKGLMWARFLIKGLRRRGNHKRKTNVWNLTTSPLHLWFSSGHCQLSHTAVNMSLPFFFCFQIKKFPRLLFRILIRLTEAKNVFVYITKLSWRCFVDLLSSCFFSF